MEVVVKSSLCTNMNHTTLHVDLYVLKSKQTKNLPNPTLSAFQSIGRTSALMEKASIFKDLIFGQKTGFIRFLFHWDFTT